MAKSWFQVVKDAIQMYHDRDKYAYFYGAKGQVLTKATMDALWAAEPKYFSKYNAEEKAQIYKNSLNKIGYDCSGFVCKVTGETGYSKTIYAKRTKETTLEQGVAGQFLYTTFNDLGRHIGLDVGMGFTLDMGNESTDYMVSVHRDSVHLARINDTKWEHSFQTAAVNYDGSYSTDPNDASKVFPRPAVATTALYVRTGPGANYPKMPFDRGDGKGKRNSLYQGENVTLTGEDGNWYSIEIPGKNVTYEGWASKTYLKNA